MLPLLGLFGALAATPAQVPNIEVGVPRRIVTDAGAGGYQAFPDICRLKNGDLYCVFYAGYDHVSHPSKDLPLGGRICSIRSRDDGKTWSKPEIVIDTPFDDRDPSVICLPNGELLCNFFTYGRNQEVDVYLTRSKDGGKSWSAPEIVLPGFACSTQIRRLRSGRLVMPVYTVDGGGKRAFAAVVLSDNGGKTWMSPRPVGLGAGKTIDETDVFERKDGTLLAVCREVMVGTESKDGGWTWGPVFELGFPGHCPCLLMTKSGILLMAHRVPKTSLHWSLDEGRTWAGPVPIDDFIGAYPSLVNMLDGKVLCVYYEEGKNSAIRAVEIKVGRK